MHACKKRKKSACDADGIFRLYALDNSTILHLSQLISFTCDGPELFLRRGWSIRETESQGRVLGFPVEPQHFANIIVQIALREGWSPYTTARLRLTYERYAQVRKRSYCASAFLSRRP